MGGAEPYPSSSPRALELWVSLRSTHPTAETARPFARTRCVRSGSPAGASIARHVAPTRCCALTQLMTTMSVSRRLLVPHAAASLSKYQPDSANDPSRFGRIFAPVRDVWVTRERRSHFRTTSLADDFLGAITAHFQRSVISRAANATCTPKSAIPPWWVSDPRKEKSSSASWREGLLTSAARSTRTTIIFSPGGPLAQVARAQYRLAHRLHPGKRTLGGESRPVRRLSRGRHQRSCAGYRRVRSE